MRGKVTSLHLAGIMVAAALAGTTTVRGAGFALYEMSARGNALGGTLVGITGDASAAYFNPANMTANAGVQMMAGASFIGPKTDVKTTVPTPMGPAQLSSESKTRWWTPPHAYATMQASEKAWIGLAIYSPFGLGSEFNSEWPGRYNSYSAIIETVDVNPSVAYKVDEKLSVAVGLQIMTFDLELKRKLPNAVVPGGPDMDFELKGDSVGYGGNAAISYQVSEKLGLGLVYRSEVDQTVEGDANLTVMGHKMGTPGEGDLTLPAATTFGANYKVDKLTLGLAVTYTEWSSYDELRIKFDDPTMLGRSESVSEKDWNNVWRYAAGAEYALNANFDLRCSYVYDEDPIPNKTADYLVPSNDRHLVGAGVGWHRNRTTVDLGYTYLMITDRDDVPARMADGVFPSSFEDGYAHIVAASVSTRF
jgi:long-chain fatty acid transport protein